MLSEEKGNTHPLDFLERMFIENSWEFSRPHADSFSAITSASWTEYRLEFEWQRDAQVLAIACAPCLKVPLAQRKHAQKLVESVNRELWFGHFEFLTQSAELQFRYGVPLFMLNYSVINNSANNLDAKGEYKGQHEQDALFCSRMAHLLEYILGLCERYYPALVYALAEEKPSNDELQLALQETQGCA